MTPRTSDWWRPYLGGAYLWRGRQPQVNRMGAGGVDCWGLYAHVMRHDFGRPVNDFGADYSADMDVGPGQARAWIATGLSHWYRVPWEEGAAALFKVDGVPVHLGICLAQFGYVLHAHEASGVDTLNVPQSIRWKDRLEGCYLPG